MSHFLTKKTIDELDTIKELIFNGQKKHAAKAFNNLKCSSSEYSQYIGTLNPDEGYDFCMLGFYSRNLK